jgi:hypothetical protein
MKLTDLINEEKYTIIDPKGNQAGTGTKDQANKRQKKLGGSKKGYFVVPAKKALKARRTLEKYKFDFKNTKLQDLMSDLYFEGVDESVNEEQINEIGVLGVAGGVALGLVGVIALSKGVNFAKRKFGDAMYNLTDKLEKKVKKIESDKVKNTIMDIAKKFENDKKLQDMYQALPKYKERGSNSQRNKGMAEIAKYVKSKLSSEEMNYFYDLNTYLRTGKIKGTLVAPENKTPFQNRLDKLRPNNESVNEGASTEEKRIVMMAVKKIAKYRNVPLDYAVGDVMRAAEELERDIKKGKVK